MYSYSFNIVVQKMFKILDINISNALVLWRRPRCNYSSRNFHKQTSRTFTNMFLVIKSKIHEITHLLQQD